MGSEAQEFHPFDTLNGPVHATWMVSNDRPNQPIKPTAVPLLQALVRLLARAAARADHAGGRKLQRGCKNDARPENETEPQIPDRG